MARVLKVDRYIALEVFRPFLGASAFFVFIFFMFQTFRLADFLIVHHVPWLIVARIALCMITSFSPLVLPVAFLAAVLIAFGRMSGESETVAFKASGLSLVRMTRPVIAISIGVSLFSLLLALELAPLAERTMGELTAKVASTRVSTALREKTFNVGFYDLLLYTDEIDPVSGTLKKVFLYDEREAGYPVVVVARYGKIRAVGNGEGRVLLTLTEGKSYRIDPLGQSSSVSVFKDYSLFLSTEEGGGADEKRPRMCSTATLLTRIKETVGGERLEYRTELWKRIWTSLSALVFGFLGVGLGVVRTRAVQSRGALLTLIAMTIYWESLVWASGQSQGGVYPSWVAMMLPNLVMAVPAGLAFWRSSW